MNDVTEAMLVNLGGDERKAALACDAKHTKYQPSDEEFCCPKCGAKCGEFCVDDGPNLDCPLIHDDDHLACYGKRKVASCPDGYGTSGKAFAAALQRKKGLVPCSHCKGKGLVPKGK